MIGCIRRGSVLEGWGQERGTTKLRRTSANEFSSLTTSTDDNGGVNCKAGIFLPVLLTNFILHRMTATRKWKLAAKKPVALLVRVELCTAIEGSLGQCY